jgi:methyl-accepting chemotaxis protein
MAFAVAGIVFIVASKSLGLHPFWVTGVPVAIMIAYALMVAFARRLRLRDDQIGDNFYYMGFIYTLVSLGMSLYQYSSGQSVDDIVRNFGVAVASTISGIVLRILFNQLRRDPVEFESVSRLDLAEAARKVRREMDGIQNEIVHFRRTNMQMLDEAFHEAKNQMSELTGKTGEMSAAIALAAERLEQASKSLAEAAEFTAARNRNAAEEARRPIETGLQPASWAPLRADDR